MEEGFSESFFEHKGFRNFFLTGGQGDPIVFLHPLGGSTELWEENYSALARSHRVLAIDFLGCGRSDKPDISYQLADFAERLVAFMDHAQIDRAALVGNSLGGHLALLVGAHYPTRVSKIVVANPSGLSSFTRSTLYSGIVAGVKIASQMPISPTRFGIKAILKSFHGVAGERNRKLTSFYARQMKGPDADRWKRAFVRTLQAIGSEPVDREVSEIEAPTLILWGQKDRVLGRGGGAQLLKKMPNATLLELEGVGHFPQIEDPQRFNLEVERFLSGLSTS